MSVIESNCWLCYFSKYASPLSICYAPLYLCLSWLFHCHNTGSQLLTQFWRLLYLINSSEHYHPAVTLALIFFSWLSLVYVPDVPVFSLSPARSAQSVQSQCNSAVASPTTSPHLLVDVFSSVTKSIFIKNNYETSNKIYFQSKSMNSLGLLLHMVSQRVLIIFIASSTVRVNLFYCTQIGNVN